MRKRVRIENPKKKTNYVILFFLIILLLGIYVLNAFKNSVLSKDKERIHVLFYGKEANLYSIGRKDNVHYVMRFYPDLKVKVPGGYGYYRVGALGKLIELEHNPDLMRRTFSSVSNSFVSYYFYPIGQEIYFGKELRDLIQLPHFNQIFFSRSNTNFVDKLYFFFFFLKRPDQFEEINYRSKVVNEDEYFQDDIYTKKYLGYFFDREYREEQKTVRIFYETSYTTAVGLSRILDGEGIRVVDIAESGTLKQSCVVREVEPFSKTAKDIANFLSCSLKAGEVEGSDIMITLGDKEKEWELR